MKLYILSEDDVPFTALDNVLGEVIMCKDCKYCNVYYHGDNMPFSYECRLLMLTSIRGGDYCSRAERKEE